MDHSNFYRYGNENKEGFIYSLNEQDNSLDITNKEGDKVLKIELQTLIENLHNNHKPSSSNYKELPSEILSVQAKTDSLAFKVLFDELGYRKKNDNTFTLDSGGEAYILYKELQ